MADSFHKHCDPQLAKAQGDEMRVKMRVSFKSCQDAHGLHI